MRKKIAEYEFDAEEMDSKNSLLARVLKSPEEYTDLISEWINEIDYYVLPISFASEKKDEDRFVSNTMKINKAVNKVNFLLICHLNYIYLKLYGLCLSVNLHLIIV